jgi:TolA-binding protein
LGANIRLRYGNGRGLDNDSYESAVKQFEQNNKQAISGFSAYISSFPTGIHSLQANFYLAQAYYYSEGRKTVRLRIINVINQPEVNLPSNLWRFVTSVTR